MESIQEAINQKGQDNNRAEDEHHSIREGLQHAKERVAEGYEKVSHKAHEVWDNNADKSLNDVVHSVRWYVRHKPGRCMLMAAGAGLIFGLLLRGHRR